MGSSESRPVQIMGMYLTNVFYRCLDALVAGKSLIVSYGGSSSSKTISALQLLTLKCMKNPSTVVIVVGSSLPKLRTTCIQDFKSIVMGPRYNYRYWNETKAVYTFINGSHIKFIGADKPDRFRGVRCDYSMFDEATEIPKGAFDHLWIRTRIASIVTFNPSKKFWIVKEMSEEYCEVIHSTYKDNEFVEQKIKDDLERKMLTDKNFYNVYAKGEWGVQEGLVFPHKKLVTTWPTRWKWRAVGVDFGWNHPYAITDSLEYNNELYCRQILIQQKLTNDNAAVAIKQFFQEQGERFEVICDSASPRDIEHMQRLGLPARPCVKGQGSVLYGIRVMQQIPINVLASSEDLDRQFDNYSWLKNRMTGEILDMPEKVDDDGVDAVRYTAAEKLVYQGRYVMG